MKTDIALWEKAKIPFYDDSCHCGENEGACTLTPFLLEDGRKHAAVIVFPGGGYVHHAEKEAAPVAEYLNSIGLHAFVLNYRVIPYPPYLGYVDGKRAVRYVREHAKEFSIYDDRIGVMGFSAGAGNACMVAEQYDKEDYEPLDEIDEISARPDFCVLCYGALSFHLKFLCESDIEIFEKFVPKEQREEFIKTYSCDELVRTDMPPVFVWHAVDDERVKVGACISFVKRMTEMKNDIECHLFPSGGHGKGVVEAVQIEGLSQWLDLFENWLKRKGFC